MASTSLARIIGMTVFFEVARSRRMVNSPFLPGLAVLASSFFFFGFAFADGTFLSFLLWSLRVVTIVLYFPTYQALVLRHAPDSFKATWFSAAGMIMGLGAIAADTMLAAVNPSFEERSFVVLGSVVTAAGGCLWLLAARADRRLNAIVPSRLTGPL